VVMVRMILPRVNFSARRRDQCNFLLERVFGASILMSTLRLLRVCIATVRA